MSKAKWVIAALVPGFKRQPLDMVITSLSPVGGEKMSKHSVAAGNIAGLLARFVELKKKAEARPGSVLRS